MGGVFNPYDDTYLLTLIAIIDALCDGILDDTTAIREVTDAEPVLEETGGTITTDGTEQTVYVNDSPSGVFEPRIFSLDFTNQTITETLRVRVYYREVSGGGYIKRSDTTFAAVQDPLSKEVTLRPNRFGIMVTIQKTVGTNRAYIWEVFYEVHP